MGDFKKLRVWREAREFVLLSNKAIKRLPDHERYVLADQWRREGTGRKGPREFCRYLGFALGSLHEIEAILELIEGLEYITPPEIAELKSRRADCARMVYGMIQRFR